MHREQMTIERFTFRAPNRGLGWCKVEEISLADDRVVVIATEPEDNPGMSITNAAEYVASDVCRRLEIDPHRLVWIEHYGYPSPVPKLPRTYDLVTFARITPDSDPIFHEPTWSAMKDVDWHALGLSPRPNEH